MRKTHRLLIVGAAMALLVFGSAVATSTTAVDAAQPGSPTPVFESNFDGGVDAFEYADDQFRATSQGPYASGQWTAGGGFSGGGLEVTLGGIDNANVLNMSGGWSRGFTLAGPTAVTITVRYELRQSGAEESDETSQALLSVDGALIGIAPNNYLARIDGDGDSGPPLTTGWQQVTVSTGELGAGDHTIAVGGYTNKKTFANEVTTIVFDDVAVVADPLAPPPANVDPLVESGVLSGVTDTWQTVALSNTYRSPVVIATVALLDSSQDAAVTRVRNAGATSFEVRVQTTNGVNAAAFAVHYFVVDEGVFSNPLTGLTMEAVRVESAKTAGDNNWVRESRSYANSYTNPVVLGQVMSHNDTDWSVFWASTTQARTAPPSASSFAAGKHVGEDPDVSRANETIGYVVIEAGSGTFGGLNFEAGVGTDSVRGVGQTTTGYSYPLTVNSPTTAILSSAALDGNNGGWPVLYGFGPVSNGRLGLAFDEDIAGDDERNHTTEQVAFLVLGTSF